MNAAAVATFAAVMAVAVAAVAQTIDVGVARTLVVGAPPGARTDRIDGARSGVSRDPLPAGALRIEWQTPIGALIDDAPVVDGHGTTYVVGTRGEVVAVDHDGTERWRASTGAVQPGPATLLSDDTIVFADALGEAIAVRSGTVRWRVHFGRGDASHPAPLPLDDGGVVVATAHDLAVLDVDGHERARATLREAVVGPLLSALGKIVVTGADGTVWAWSPGAVEVIRAASFDSPTEGGASLVDARTLVAVTSAGMRLTAIDLVEGNATTRAVATGGLWLGPPAVRAGNVHLMLMTPTAELAVAIDAAGAETMRARLAMRTVAAAADGGAAPLAAAAHTPPVVDAKGTLAFANADGSLGIVYGPTVELLTGACSSPSRVASPDALRPTGIAPLGSGAFVVACHAGELVAVGTGPLAGGGRTGHL